MTPIQDAVPEDFAHAYGELVALVTQISRAEVPKEISHEVLEEKVDKWKHADCRGAATLAEAAVKALQYELASRGLREGAGTVQEDLRALSHIESVLARPVSGEREALGPKIVEVVLRDAYRKDHPRARGFKMNDEFQILFEPGEAGGPPHAHLSISHPRRYPTFEEILQAASAPGVAPPNLWALVPERGQQHSIFEKTVHLYVRPPEGLIGRKKK